MKNLQHILNDLRIKKPKEVTLFLCGQNVNLDSLFESKINYKLIKEFIELIEVCLETNSLSECLARAFVPKLLQSNLWKKFICGYFSQKITNRNEFLSFTRSVINICHSMLKINTTELEKLKPLIEKLDSIVKYELNNLDLLNHYNYGLGKLVSKANQQQKNDNSKHFTQLSILPVISDILTDKKSYLNKNLIYGFYPNVNSYLDTQFRLLREDFLQPLRFGIGKFRGIIRDNRIYNNQKLNDEIRYKLSRIESLNVYFDVKMINNICTDHGVVYTIQLDGSSRTKINWEFSKRLIFGSLICLSSDFYSKECIIGTVCNRDSDTLINQGLIQIKFNIDINELINGRFNFPVLSRTYVMLETTAFFESYKHVLHALVSFGLSSELEFPFRENIVDARNSRIPRPDYLKNATIDFRPLVDQKKIQKKDMNGFSMYEFSNESIYAKNCSVLKPDEWPKAQQMGLDESQYEAVKLALESKLALIQGPPGTGKTYIGVKLVELLVHNKNLWWQRPGDRKRPILMVCYTNHALDQFLEYCVNVCKLDQGVVRVGSRCKNENLNSFLLSNLKKNHKYDRGIMDAIRTEKNKLIDLQTKVDKLNTILNGIDARNGLVSFNMIKKYIHDKHFKQFNEYNQNMNNFQNRTALDYTMLEWLGVFDIDTHLITDISKSVQKIELDTKKEQVDKSILMLDYDNQYLNNERMLEDDFEFEKLVSKSRNKNSHLFIEYDEISDMSFYFNELSTTDYSNSDKFLKKRRNLKPKNDITLIKEHFEYLYQINQGRTNYHLDENYNIWRLNINERFSLYLTWLEKLRLDKQSEMEKLVKQFNQSSSMLQEIRMQKDKSVLENALIIAMTTTGSSRYHKILKDIGPRIVIVEEAAEVFEAHIVSSLSKHCEHLILIGDHAQLRPNPAVYNLAIDYHLDVSLFERLLNNNAKKVMLETQHRMRPEISLLMKHFYEKNILNHSSVLKFDSIRGLDKNIFFINHSKLETKISESLSKSNQYEAIYLTKLCQYLIKQNYMPNQITVLTMYLGQTGELRNLLRNQNLTDIKVSTVDNFQGEENDIILLSLVRSNDFGKIGFLNIHNRVCVALSRARKGFICIGNLDFISKHSDKWANIIEHLKQLDCVGHGLKLTCSSHPENDIIAIEPEDFDKRLDGGCYLKCNYMLKCGHNCPNYCHGNVDSEHLKFQCRMPCEKINSNCGHKCTRLCYQTDECNSCKFKVEKLVPECGHTIKLYCNTEPIKTFCSTPCNFELKCGHKCSKVCAKHLNSNDHDLNCQAQIEIETPCQHKTKIFVSCSESKWSYEKLCNRPCGVMLDCGHQCNRLCGECISGRVHVKCDQIITREMPCEHKSIIECWRRFEPCEKECFFRCKHRILEQSCYLPRSVCKKKCSYNCPHYKCDKKCTDFCDRPACNEACEKLLKCGHKCIGICGEPCPRLCRVCDRTKVTKIYFGTERDEKAKFVFLFDCKHLLESTGLDNWIKTNSLHSLPLCPKCKTPIRSTLRYANFIKQEHQKIEELKRIEYGDAEENIYEQLKIVQEIETFTQFKSPHNKFDLRFISEIFNILNIRQLTRNELIAINHSFTLFKNLFDLKYKFSQANESQYNYEIQKIEDLIWDLKNDKPSFYFDEQNFYEILNEIKRANFILKFKALNVLFLSQDNFLTIEIKQEVSKILDELNKYFYDSANLIQGNEEIFVSEKFNHLESLLSSAKNQIVSSKQIFSTNLNGEFIQNF